MGKFVKRECGRWNISSCFALPLRSVGVLATAVSFLVFLLFAVVPVTAQETGIEVRTQDPGVKVYVDGNYRGVTVPTAFGFNFIRITGLAVGPHTIRCEAANFQPFEQQVNVEEGKVLPVNVKFERPHVQGQSIQQESGTLVMQTGTIIVHSTPTYAYCLLDGKNQETTDAQYSQVPVGRHKIEVFFDRADPKKDLSVEVTVQAASTLNVTADFINHEITTDAKYSVTFRSRPAGAILSIDGDAVGRVPQTVKLLNGVHSIEMSLPGYESYRATYVAKSNDFVMVALKEATYEIDLESKPEGASVFVERHGQKELHLGSTPCVYRTHSGVYRFRFKKDGYEDGLQTVTTRPDTAKYTTQATLKGIVWLTFTKDTQWPNTNSQIQVEGKSLGLPPIRETRIIVNGDKLLISSAGYNYSVPVVGGHHYDFLVHSPLKMLPLIPEHNSTNSESLSGFEPIPSRPALLSETKSAKVKHSLFSSGGTMAWAYPIEISALSGFLIDILKEGSQPGGPTGAGMATFSIVGGLVGAVISALPIWLPTNENVPDEANIKQNRTRLAQWQREVDTVNHHNEAVIAAANVGVRERNAKIEKENTKLEAINSKEHRPTVSWKDVTSSN